MLLKHKSFKVLLLQFLVTFASSETVSSAACDTFPFLCNEQNGIQSSRSSQLMDTTGSCMDKSSVPHKYNKCFTLIEQELNFTEALQECRTMQPDHDSNLVVIEDSEEYEFLIRHIFRNLQPQDRNLWIGSVGFQVGSEWIQKWVDNTQIPDTNWAYLSPSPKSEDDDGPEDDFKCVSMSRRVGEEEAGRWSYASCSKKNFFVCQSLQRLTPIKVKQDLQENSGRLATLEDRLENLVQEYEQKLYNVHEELQSGKSQLSSQKGFYEDFLSVTKKHERSILELESKIQQFQNNPVPIGFIYVQLPRRQSPSSLWPGVVWQDVTSDYAGLFFRAEGGQASSFGTTQAHGSPRLINVYKHDDPDDQIVEQSSLSLGSISGPVQSGFYVPQSVSKDKYGLKFLVSSVETRPVNTAVRIWTRIR